MRDSILAALVLACFLPAVAADGPSADDVCVRSNTTAIPVGACVYGQPAACLAESSAFGHYVDVGCYPCGLDVDGHVRLLCY